MLELQQLRLYLKLGYIPASQALPSLPPHATLQLSAAHLTLVRVLQMNSMPRQPKEDLCPVVPSEGDGTFQGGQIL
eukprot:1140558-Pelagomonas_calceolata.AAC.6